MRRRQDDFLRSGHVRIAFLCQHVCEDKLRQKQQHHGRHEITPEGLMADDFQGVFRQAQRFDAEPDPSGPGQRFFLTESRVSGWTPGFGPSINAIGENKLY